MSDNKSDADRMFDIMGAICDDCASDSEFADMDAYLRAGHISYDRYLHYCWMHVALTMESQVQRAVQNVHRQINSGPVIPTLNDTGIADATRTAPPISAIPAATRYSSLGYLSAGWPMAYLIAMVIVGVGLATMSILRVSPPTPIAATSISIKASDGQSPPLNPSPKATMVGRITGMVDCKWSNPHEAAASGDPVAFGRQYSMASGLMEITYDTVRESHPTRACPI